MSLSKHHLFDDNSLTGQLTVNDDPAPPIGPQTVLFDDTADVIDQGGQFPLFPDDETAQSFSTGADAVVLNEIIFTLEDPTPSDGGTITVSLWSDNDTSPGAQLDVLGTIDDSSLPFSPGQVDLTISGDVSLTAGTRYWIELNGDGNTQSDWDSTLSNAGTGVFGEFVDAEGTIFQDGPGGVGTLLMKVIASTSTCYAEGTHILTDRGELPVEALRAGDFVLALHRGGLAQVRWIGTSRVDLRRHPARERMDPVRIRAGAFAPDVPHRDLLVSPDHALFIDGAFIAARYVLNGATIAQESPDDIIYYHVELDVHDILLAEGLAAESYLDVGNRAAFGSTPGVTILAPAFDAAPDAQAIWDAHACAPSLRDPAARAALHGLLLDRALALGHETTEDPALVLMAAGRVIPPEATGDTLRFALPPETTHVRLLSRTAIPAHFGAPDGRRLGVGVRHIMLDDAPIARDDPRLAAGWHAPEPSLRWTNGAAQIDASGARSLALRLHRGLRYWGSAAVPHAHAA